jgi:uncharacterized membrane protein YuzA (DUF378 family)
LGINKPEREPAMNITNISWYLCGLFAFATMIGFVVTVHPKLQNTIYLFIGGAAAISLVFGIFEFEFNRRGFKESKWLLFAFRCLAVLATIFIIFGIVG